MPPSYLISRYHLEQEIGSGGIGAVFRAIDTKTDTKVAIKLLHAEFARIPDYVARFHRGAEIAQDLHSPYIVRVLDHGRDGDEHYLIMEYVDGKSLFDLLKESRRLPAREARTIMQHVALALDAAHQRRVVHRDISPGNILLAKDGTAKVSDFDIAHNLDSTRMTSAGMFLGKVQYSAPETLRGKTDIRSDLYALGAVAYEMILGRPPFEATNVLEALELHQNEEPPALDEIARRDPLLGVAIARCLAKSPDERYQEPRELLLALDGHAMPVPRTVARQPSQLLDHTRTLRTKSPKRATRRRSRPAAPRTRLLGTVLLLAGIASVAAAGVAGIVVLAVGGTADSARQNTSSEGNDPTVPVVAPSLGDGVADTGCDFAATSLLRTFPLPSGSQCYQSAAYAYGSYPEPNKTCDVENWDRYSRAIWETASFRVASPLASVATFYYELRLGDRFLGFTDGGIASYAWGVGQTGMQVEARAGEDPAVTDLRIEACRPVPEISNVDPGSVRAAFGEMPLPEGAQLASVTNEGSCFFADGYELLDRHEYQTFIPPDLFASLAQRLPGWTMEPESSTAASFKKDNLLLRVTLDPESARLVVYRCFRRQEP